MASTPRDGSRGRYTTLFELRRQYGADRRAATATPEFADTGAIAAPGAGPSLLDLRSSGRSSDTGSAPRRPYSGRSAELIRSFRSYGVGAGFDGTAALTQSPEVQQQETEAHVRFLASLVHLRGLATDLDLNFKCARPSSWLRDPPRASAASSLAPSEEVSLASESPRSMLKADPLQQEAACSAYLQASLGCEYPLCAWAGRQVADDSTVIGDADSANDLRIQIELLPATVHQVRVTPQAMVVRVPRAWEMYPLKEDMPVARPVWGGRQRKLRDELSVGSKVRAIGDKRHACSLELLECAPQTLMLRRRSCCPGGGPPEAGGCGGGGGGGGGGACTPTSTATTLPVSNATSVRGGAAGGGGGGEGQLSASLAEDALRKLAAIHVACERQEGHLRQELVVHAAQLHERSPTPPSAAAPASAQQQPRQEDSPVMVRAKEYMLHFREVLRLVLPVLPAAARALEAAVKGIVVSLGEELEGALRLVDELRGQLPQGGDSEMDAAAWQSKAEGLEQELGAMREQLEKSRRDHTKEVTRLKGQIDALKHELHIVSPDIHTEMQGFAGLVKESGALLEELEQETGSQNKILEKLSRYTVDIIRAAGDHPAWMRNRETGRMVELPNGEVLLRPHAVAEQGTQATTSDVLAAFPSKAGAPIRLRHRQVRQLLAVYDGAEVDAMDINELAADIDKIYSTKMVADLEADAVNISRSSLWDYTMHYFLDRCGSVTRAEDKMYSMLRRLILLERSPASAPAKLTLFSRFLELCEHKKALPRPVLDFVLNVKRHVQGKVEKPPDKIPLPTRHGAPTQKPQVLEHPDGVLCISDAFDGGHRVVSASNVVARREFMTGLCRLADIESETWRKNGMREFLVLVIILHDRLHREAAPTLRDIISRLEVGQRISPLEFQQALRDAGVHGLDESIWKSKLTQPATPAVLIPELLLEYFGGGSQARLPSATLTETNLMVIMADVMVVMCCDSVRSMKSLWDRRSHETNGALGFEDVKDVLRSAEPSLSPALCRAVYLDCVEMTRACTQREGEMCDQLGTLRRITTQQGSFGGETVTFSMLSTAALRFKLFEESKSAGPDLGLPPPKKRSADATLRRTVISTREERRGTRQGKSPSHGQPRR